MEEDCEELHKDLDGIHKRSLLWEMKFNANKCHVMKVGKIKNDGRKHGGWEKKLNELK